MSNNASASALQQAQEQIQRLTDRNEQLAKQLETVIQERDALAAKVASSQARFSNMVRVQVGCIEGRDVFALPLNGEKERYTSQGNSPTAQH